jgi:hypothetical protein
MPQSDYVTIPILTGQILQELGEWRRRLRLAYDMDWDWRAKEICKEEIRRLEAAKALMMYGGLNQ